MYGTTYTLAKRGKGKMSGEGDVLGWFNCKKSELGERHDCKGRGTR